MVLEIVLGITACLTAKKIVSNVRSNMRMTSDLTGTKRRKLLWRYGPFTLDEYVVQQMMEKQKQAPVIPLDIIKPPIQAA